MKALFTTTLLVMICSLTAWAQVEIISVPQMGQGLAQEGDNLYISASTKIYKVDISAATPEATLILENLNYISALAVHGTNLYMGNFDKIFVVDLTASPLVVKEIATDLRYVSDLLVDGDDMYVAEQNGSKISKFDITEASPNIVDVITDIGAPTGLVKIANSLYVTRYGVRKVSKVDLTTSPVVYEDIVSTDEAPAGIAAIGNYLFYSEFDGDEGGKGKISKIDVTEASPSPEQLVSGFDAVWSMMSRGCQVFYADRSQRKIFALSSEALDKTTTTMDATITANQVGVTYQWINCADDSPIEGETGQSYKASTSGDYAVIINSGGCIDTSDCVNLTIVGLDEAVMAQVVSVYPNPIEDVVNVDLGGLSNVSLNVFDARGQLVHSQQQINTSNYKFDLTGAAPGVYIIELSAQNVRQQHRLMVK